MFKRRFRFAIAILGAVALTASPAYGHVNSHTATFTASTYALNALAAWTVSFGLGGSEPADGEIDFEAGMKFAHDDQYGNELSFNPNDDDLIGSGTVRGAWVATLCLTTQMSMDIYFEEDMTGAPAGAVAHWRAVLATIGTYHVWVMEQSDANDDYKLIADLDSTWTCSNQPGDSGFSVTFTGMQNPSVSDCKVVTVTVVDVAGTVHSGSDSKAFGTATCP